MRIWRRAQAQTLKEIAQFRRDKLTMALAWLLPFLALLMYGFATRLESKNIPVFLQNYDNGKLSREFIDSIVASKQFKLSDCHFYNGSNSFPLDTGMVQAVITIPPEFSRKLKGGRQAKIQILIDGTDVNNARVIKNAFIALSKNFMTEKFLAQKKIIIHPVIRLWFNPGRKESLHIVPGAIALVTWIFPALLSAFAMVREKEQGTILQLYASSITATELVLGKSIAYILIAIIESLIVIFAGFFIFKLPFVGDPILFSLLTLLYLSSGVLFGIWAGTRASNQMAAVQICAMVGFLGSMLLSGFMYPIRNISYPISLFSNFVAARYYVEAARDAFVRGAPWTVHWYIPLFLVIFNMFLFIISILSMRKMQLVK